jgi:L-alanine-DL-glutamate epimerase-like enolase superfamily enzyme
VEISQIELLPLHLEPAEDARGAPANIIIIRMVSSDGLVGYGEAATLPSYFNQTPGTLKYWLERYARELIGVSVSINQVNSILDRVSGARSPGVHPARAGIEMAIFELLAKAYGCPVYELLGGAHRTTFELLTQLYDTDADSCAERAASFVAKGFRAIKVKIGIDAIQKGLTRDSVREGRDLLLATLRRLPEDIYIDADANQAWGNPKLVVQVFEGILREHFFANLAVEQPLHHLDLTGHAYLRSSLPIPVILDESVTSPEAMLQIARLGAADRIVLKLNRVGGFTKARQIIAICEAASIGVSVDTMPFTKLGDTALCHLAATIRDPYPVDAEGHTWFKETPFTGGVELTDQGARLSQGAGYGVELDDGILARLLDTDGGL